eukprot:5443742-Lingulodinium_polyedra.AAC.1
MGSVGNVASTAYPTGARERQQAAEKVATFAGVERATRKRQLNATMAIVASRLQALVKRPFTTKTQMANAL